MKLRPEFELLDEYFRRLYHNFHLDQEFLRKVKDHIELCEHIAEIDVERSVIARSTYWWKKRATLFSMAIPQKELSTSVPSEPKKKYEFTASDKRFLRSLRISADP